MRRLALMLCLPIAACGSTSSDDTPSYVEPNEIMGDEITKRISEIPYQRSDELWHNLIWLSQAGEQAVPALLQALEHDSPKVRSNVAWVLGQIGDRRTISTLQAVADDADERVRLEVARSLVLMGDMEQAPELIRGLDSEHKQVRYLCHEALKTATRRDFGYDHLTTDPVARSRAVYRWRQWWSDLSGDRFFASSYADRNDLHLDPTGTPAAPDGETRPPRDEPETQGDDTTTTPETTPPTGTTPETTPPTGTTPETTPPTGSTTPETTPEPRTTGTGTTTDPGIPPKSGGNGSDQ